MRRSPVIAVIAVVSACAGRSSPGTDGDAPPHARPAVPSSPTEPVPPPETDPEPRAQPEPTHVLSLHQRAPLDQDYALLVESVVVESIEPSPDDPQAYPAGSGVVVEVVLSRDGEELRGSLSLLSEGYTGRPVAWLDDYRVTLVDVADPHRDPAVALVVERVTDGQTADPPLQGRLSKTTPLILEDGTELRFVAHGHKMTRPGQRSPLMIAVQWQQPGYDPVDQYASIEPEERRDFTWRDRVVTVVEWSYDDWMDLRIRRRAVERVTTTTPAP